MHRGWVAETQSPQLEEGREQTGEVKEAELSQGHFNPKEKPKTIKATKDMEPACSGITGAGKQCG